MTKAMRLAVPSVGNGGLEAERSGHFGHCDCFTLVDIEDGEIKEVTTLKNLPHEEGGCLRPVNLLAGEGVNAIVVAGMGARPLSGFNGVGITVYYEGQTPQVGAVVSKVIKGEVEIMSSDQACSH